MLCCSADYVAPVAGLCDVPLTALDSRRHAVQPSQKRFAIKKKLAKKADIKLD